MKSIENKRAYRTLLVGLACLFASSARSADTIHVETAGTLASLMESAGRLVKLTGRINGTDVKFLRERIAAGKLSRLDLEEVRIVSGGEAYFSTHKTENDVIGDSMFYQCSKLTAVTLPATTKDIRKSAFQLSGITKAEVPDGVTNLGGASFANCNSLKTVVIGRKVSHLGQAVFYNSPSITTVNVKPKTPPALDAYIFTARPTIRVFSSVLAEYKASSWNQYGSIVGKLENYYEEESDSSDVVNSLASTFFEDVACTELKAEYKEMDDSTLTAALTEAGMPEYMIPIALKLKNEDWAAYEKDFRIHSYKAYSDASYWNSRLKSTGGSFMGNPTGIYTTGSDPLYVFVDSEIPSDATLYIAGCTGNDLVTSATQGKMLKPGLNVVDGIPNALYYIIYTADTKSMTKTLSEWPELKIHIEGGLVNGYYDSGRHSEADYRAILRTAKHERFTVKGGQSLFNFKTSTYKNVWKRTIDKSICWFDSLTVWEKELMGICESVASGSRAAAPFYISGGESYFPQYYNNPNFAIEGESTDGGYANSAWFRTMYNTQGCVQSSFDVSKTTTFDDWCSAHECGHNNQGAITVEGGTEVSNNLFSNYVRFHDGLITSSGNSLATIMDEAARHEPFFTRPLDSQMRMYWQLYLYYHLAQHNTSFYPELFKALRNDPLTLYSSNTGCLKFVRKVCEVAQEDLTDFFRIWGFFEPLDNYVVNDYGAHYMTVYQSDINNTLAEIAQYPKKNIEILFIEDRADYVLTTDFLTTAGKKRRESEKVGQCGDVGQFTDYLPGACAPSAYTYLDADSLYALEGEGGLGFLALDASDNLIFVANAKHFCIPSSLGCGFTLYSYDADGSLHEITRVGSGAEIVKLAEAGTLSQELTGQAIKATVIGNINGTDIKYLRGLISSGNLQSIDLASANIVSGGVAYYSSYHTANNVMGAYAFDSFKNLVSIRLPYSITSIGDRAFRFSGLKMADIPDLVTSIGLEAFGGCEMLTTVIIGARMTSLSQGVFYNSPVKHVYVKALTPPTLGPYIFNSNPVIHVYPSALEAYLASDWARFGTIVGDLSDDVIDGIEEIEDIKDSKGLNDLNVATFDLFGRRVSSLRPGTIYLRNGKKFIFGK